MIPLFFAILYISIPISYISYPLIYVLSILNCFSCNWRAPEVLRGERITRHSDSWSYGMTVWEMMSLTKPFGSVTLQDASILSFNLYFVYAFSQNSHLLFSFTHNWKNRYSQSCPFSIGPLCIFNSFVRVCETLFPFVNKKVPLLAVLVLWLFL